MGNAGRGKFAQLAEIVMDSSTNWERAGRMFLAAKERRDRKALDLRHGFHGCTGRESRDAAGQWMNNIFKPATTSTAARRRRIARGVSRRLPNSEPMIPPTRAAG